jgi:hypothetical protein
VIEFLVAEKESVRNIHKRLCEVYGSATVGRSTVGPWVERVTVSETRKSDLHDLPRSGRLSQLLVLKCFSVLMPSFARIDASQLDNWRHLFVSKGSVSHII